MQHAITKLMSQHQNLPAMMRLMRKHISKHRPASRPGLRPTTPRKFLNPPLRIRRKSIRQHPQTLRRTLPMRSRSLWRSVRRPAPTCRRVLPTSGPVRWPLSTSSGGRSPAPIRCHREPTRRSRLARPSSHLRPTRTRACSPPSSGSPIRYAPIRRRLPVKRRVRPCRSGRRRLK